MNTSLAKELGLAVINPDCFYSAKINKPEYLAPLTFTKPIGHYTINPHALYGSKSYIFGIKVKNISLRDKENNYAVSLQGGKVLNEPYFDEDLDMVMFTAHLDKCVIPLLDPLSLPENLWKDLHVHLYINDVLITDEDKNVPSIPYSFNSSDGVLTDEGFYHSDKAFFLLQPSERSVFLDLVSGGGGGAGLNLSGKDNEDGVDGGDATLAYIEPETGLIKPLAFVQGGKGGRISKKYLETFNERKVQSKVFLNGQVTEYTYVESVINKHKLPDSYKGADGIQATGEDFYGHGGDGGYKEDIGFSGEGGMSGGHAFVHIIHKTSPSGEPGPLIILHPKTYVNLFNIIDDEDLDIEINKAPMTGGQGGTSMTVDGTSGNDGILIVRF